jgi:ABC-type transport system involved in multi-copper enzyme maturation permease subunit
MTIGMLANPAAQTATARNWLLETWRLTIFNLYLAWRRIMSKVLLGLFCGAYVLVLVIVLLIYAGTVASHADGADAIRDLVTFPTSLIIPGYVIRMIGPLLICILAGTLIGSEYGFGTYRLSLSRGMSRAQVLAAQVATLALLALLVAGGLLLLGTLVGVTLGPLLGSDLLIPDLLGALQIVLFWLALSLNLFVYMLVAHLFATVGRSAVAGVGGALGLILVELVVTIVLSAVALFVATRNPAAGQALATATTLLPGNSLGALVQYAGQAPIQLTSGTSESLVQALLVPLIYCALLITGSYLLFRLRDVTD